MTLYLSFRIRDVGGSVRTGPPVLLEGDGASDPDSLVAVPEWRARQLLEGRDLLFAAHGFNVSGPEGTRALGRLDAHLELPATARLVGVLWPGDFWLPVVNYPTEAGDAQACGRALAQYCNALSGVGTLSFLSHSLGARLVLEAVGGLARPAGSVCLTAAAVDRDCLTREFARASRNSGRMSVLASRDDWVLQLAYPVGDPLSDLLRGSMATLRGALGYLGPDRTIPGVLEPPFHVPRTPAIGHGNYMPPSTATPGAAALNDVRWRNAVGFMRRAFLRERQTWPV